MIYERNYLYSELSDKAKKLAVGDMRDYLCDEDVNTEQEILDYCDRERAEFLFNKEGMIVCAGSRIENSDDLFEQMTYDDEAFDLVIDESGAVEFQVYKEIDTERYFLVAHDGDLFMEVEPIAELRYQVDEKIKNLGSLFEHFDCDCAGESYSDDEFEIRYMWFRELKRK